MFNQCPECYNETTIAYEHNGKKYCPSCYISKFGGDGSGNFGHEGRPGEVGGSGEGGGSSQQVKRDVDKKTIQNIIDNDPDPANYQTAGFSFTIQLNSNLELPNSTKILFIYPIFDVLSMTYLGFNYEYFDFKTNRIESGGFESENTLNVIIDAFGNDTPKYSQICVKNKVGTLGNISFENESAEIINHKIEFKISPMTKKAISMAKLTKNNLETLFKSINIKLYEWDGSEFILAGEYQSYNELYEIDYIFVYNKMYKINYIITDLKDYEIYGHKMLFYNGDKNFFEEVESNILLDGSGQPKTIIYDYPSAAKSSLRYIEQLEYDIYNNLVKSELIKIVNTFNLVQDGYIDGHLSGTPLNIIWESLSVDIEYVKLEISYDLGDNYEVITNSTPNDGSYIWSMNKYSKDCLIKISAVEDENIFNISDRFNISISDEFGITTEQNFLPDDGVKGFGWNLLNSNLLNSLNSNITNFNELTVDINNISTWGNSPQLYKNISGNFDIEIRLMNFHNETDSFIGLFIGNSVTPANMYVVGYEGVSKIVSAEIDNNVATKTTLAFSAQFFRLKREANEVSTYYKINNEDDWIKITDYTESFPVVSKVGIICKKDNNDNTPVISRIGYFRS